ncbi:hypothetical protein [Erythrobacter sp. JK5]|uniref:hypothetical protein n=1 Tax=Erythrobacter sp. JK5 TaxID=2829500 RepID=UPI001BAA626E|nr:hypothetical protein [Erythrobacter sp. JK5]QUL37003.1 hypothetical protein KDC96_11420 [Erythrobacter sp. JK5]
MKRFLTHLFALLALVWSGPALADVQIHFHSFNGSVLFGRYPHTFVVLEGTLEETGEVVNENYGFSARKVTPAILNGPVEHMVLAESEKNIRKTNRHFTIDLTDAQYRQVVAEVRRWQNAPGKYYDLESRNCIHFVGKIAQLLGLKVDYPQKMLRRPKAWLNHVAAMNPKLGAKAVK